MVENDVVYSTEKGNWVNDKDLFDTYTPAQISALILKKPKRVWLHTCSLDHENALRNYISRGMKIFKKESVNI